MPALEVATAGNPEFSKIRALGRSQALGSTNNRPGRCRALKASAFSFWESKFFLAAFIEKLELVVFFSLAS